MAELAESTGLTHVSGEEVGTCHADAMSTVVLIEGPAQIARQRTRLALAIERHALLRLMPAKLREAVIEGGEIHCAATGALIDGRSTVRFILDGVTGAFDPAGIACVALHGPGSMTGWENVLVASTEPAPLLALVTTRWIEVAPALIGEAMDEAWLEHVFARHALDHLTRLQSEAACNAVHAVPARIANRVRRLCLLTGPQVRTTQSVIAQSMGVQRTSVNAAMKALERDGALRLGRGRIEVLDQDHLATAACGC